jgi:hypothetical protein
MSDEMVIKGCEVGITLTGSARRRLGFYSTAAAAEVAAKEIAHRAAEVEADYRKRAYRCPNPVCGKKIVGSVSVKITSISFTGWSLQLLWKSPFDFFRRRYHGGHVDFAWRANLTCKLGLLRSNRPIFRPARSH